MHEWEEPSWISRSAAFFSENYAHTPIWMTHGEWDRAIGGGVPTAHSLQMKELLEKESCPAKLTIEPATGHGCRNDDNFRKVIDWMLQQRKERSPEAFTLSSSSPRHTSSYGIRIAQFETYGCKAKITFQRKNKPASISTQNVRVLSVDTQLLQENQIKIDGQVLTIETQKDLYLIKNSDGWSQAGPLPSGSKCSGQSGPISDGFFERTLFVLGTIGCAEESFHLKNVAHFLTACFKHKNGGIHRGGIPGKSFVEWDKIEDTQLPHPLPAGNFFLMGTPQSNAVLKRFENDIPLSFSEGSLNLAGKHFEGKDVATICILPRPDGEEGYFTILGGVSPDAVCWGAYLNLNLLPDYLVFNKGEVLEWGFFNPQWKMQQ